ncbi:putative leucine-rich repeat receptor-like serine/threonine-protein kinase [Gossypium australe]|uniref:Putative leucine-rich repeat receptor-like serine/threonine-protein kinase n=1 Tax=Gossypium australe TaxID=47621 RepID=A0A5B6VTP2_9ROSI|nr:putative leucine-rich repeat receptor-like serine/threonine-protein kinase [Gossypium australe]
MFIHRLLFASVFIVCCLTTLTNGATLPNDEVEALKSIGKILRKTNWNFDIDPCSRGNSWLDQPTRYYANNVTCDCSFNNNITCHVTYILLTAQNLLGTLPPNLTSLPFLQKIDLTRNYLSGPIPPEWGSTRLVSISLLGNRLTGSIPGELANLRNLTSLHISSNKFTGEIPEVFARLTSLKEFRISDNNFIGQIPDFIFQNWTNLEQIYMEGSGLSGPIPSINATSENLEYIIISDLNGAETSFPQLFINASLPKLDRLDLSYNNFTDTGVSDCQQNTPGIVPCLKSLINCTSERYKPPSKSGGHISTATMAGIVAGATFATLLIVGIFWWNCCYKLDDEVSGVLFGDEFQNGMELRKFSLVQIAKMTNNFNGEKLGKGGFGVVYKGYLRDSDTYVAVKRISKASKQGIKEYASEVKIISQSRHKNLVKLIGQCHEKGELILVYELMANGSLDSHLFKEGDHCVLHRDIKASNIMLDSSFNAKLGDFGLARLVDHEKASQTTHLAGTLGYLAPECVSSGKASKESDIYSFGVVALEIACGRRSIESKYEESQVSLVAWVWDSYGSQRLLDVADPKLSMNFDAKQMECLLMIGLWCIHPDQHLRPSIRQTIQVLNFEAPLPKLPSTRPTATYNAQNTTEIHTSEPCFADTSITVPR